MEKNQTTNKDSILIVGNGPSAADPKAAYLKDANTKVFRLNWFFLEPTINFGRQVDWHMLCFYEAVLIYLLRHVIAGEHYDIKQLIAHENPLQAEYYIQQYRRYFGDDFVQQLYEKHGRNLLAVSELPTGVQAMFNKHQKNATYPTAAVLAFTQAAAMGFRDIRIVGLDFYRGDSMYGLHDLPAHLHNFCYAPFKRQVLNKIRKLSGQPLLSDRLHIPLDKGQPYQKTDRMVISIHSIQTDIDIIQAVLDAYPDIELTVFCTEPALAVWQQVKGIKLLAAGDIQDTAPAPDNRFIPLLDTIKLNRAQQRKVVIWMWKLWLMNTRSKLLMYIKKKHPNLYRILRPIYLFLRTLWRFIRDRTWMGRWVWQALFLR